MDLSRIAVFVLLWTSGVSAHELEVAVHLAAPAVIVHAAYAGTDPVAFAKVQVFAPASPSQEFQTGVTDRRGYFSFVPAGSGAWRVVVDDEEGHRTEVSASVPQPFNSNSVPLARSSSRLERAALGIALIIGATGFLYGFKARRALGPRPPS
jgi:nickel transport protein